MTSGEPPPYNIYDRSAKPCGFMTARRIKTSAGSYALELIVHEVTIAVGVQQHLPKPFELDALVAAIASLVKQR